MKGKTKVMSFKQKYTAEYVSKLLKCCASKAYVNIIIKIDGVEKTYPITSLMIHQTADKKELISFSHDTEDLENV